MDPQSAKWQFKCRTLVNICLVFVIFLPLVAFFSVKQVSWILYPALIAILFYLYFFILDKRAINFDCPHCGNCVATNTVWVCGNCNHKNQNVDDFPFIARCENCKAEPKAYKCHHRTCGNLIFLSPDKQEDGYAVAATEGKAPTEKNAGALREEAKQAKAHEIAMAELEEKLEAFKARRERSKKKSPLEALKEDFEKDYVSFMAAEEFVREQRAIVDEKFKDDEYMRKKAHLLLDHLLKRRID